MPFPTAVGRGTEAIPACEGVACGGGTEGLGIEGREGFGIFGFSGSLLDSGAKEICTFSPGPGRAGFSGAFATLRMAAAGGGGGEVRFASEGIGGGETACNDGEDA